jgi:hypothetical protein
MPILGSGVSVESDQRLDHLASPAGLRSLGCPRIRTCHPARALSTAGIDIGSQAIETAAELPTGGAVIDTARLA